MEFKELLFLLKKERKRKGMSLKLVGELSGVDPSRISKMERGKKERMSLKNFLKIANALGIKIMLVHFVSDGTDYTSFNVMRNEVKTVKP